MRYIRKQHYKWILLSIVLSNLILIGGCWWLSSSPLATWSVGEAVAMIAFSPDGQLLAVAQADLPAYNRSKIEFRRVADGTSIRVIISPVGGISSLTFSPDGQLLALSGGSTIEVWRVDNGTRLYALAPLGKEKLSSGFVAHIGFSLDGQTIRSTTTDGALRIWRVADGELLQTVIAPKAQIHAQAFTGSVDNMLIAGRLKDDLVVRSTDGSQVVMTNGRYYGEPQTNRSLGLSFSSDGAVLAGFNRYDISLWHVRDGSVLTILDGHTDSIHSMAFSPDDRMIATGSGEPFVFPTEHTGDKTIRLWRASDGKLLKTFRAHKNRILSLAFSPDGKLLASASMDGTIKLWQVNQ